MLKVENTLNSSIINAFLGNHLIRCAVLSQVFELVSLQKKKKKKGFFLLTVLMMSFCGSYSSVSYLEWDKRRALGRAKIYMPQPKSKNRKSKKDQGPIIHSQVCTNSMKTSYWAESPLIFTTKTLGGNS